MIRPYNVSPLWEHLERNGKAGARRFYRQERTRGRTRSEAREYADHYIAGWLSGQLRSDGYVPEARRTREAEIEAMWVGVL